MPRLTARRRTRRLTELLFLMAAVTTAGFGYLQVGLAHNREVPSDLRRHLLVLGLLALAAHLTVRFRATYADPLLLPAAVLLNGLGLVLITRLDLTTPDAPAAPAQVLWSTLGVAFFILVVLPRDYRRLQRYTFVCAAAALVLLVLPLFFPAVYGAKIWVLIGPLSLQPGEFTKILLTVFFAGYLATRGHTLTLTGRRLWRFQLPSARVLAPILVIWLISVLVLVAERDLGTSLVFFGVFVAMLYLATDRGSWVAICLLMTAVGALFVGWLEPHVHGRVENWLHPLASINAGEGANQLAQSMFAFASGGLLGTGLGHGHSSLIGFAAKSDFILATAGEELGFVGLTMLILLYAVIVTRGFRAGLALRDPFGGLLGLGLAVLFGIQVFVVAAGVTDLIPLTGMTMPFLAQGGSSVVTNWVLIALLVKLSDQARRPEPAPDPEPDGAPLPNAPPMADAEPTEPVPPVEPEARRAAAGPVLSWPRGRRGEGS